MRVEVVHRDQVTLAGAQTLLVAKNQAQVCALRYHFWYIHRLC